MQIDPRTRAAARESQSKLETVARWARGVAAALGLSSVSTPAFASLAGVSALINVLASEAADVKRRTADDPPRGDYDRQTRQRRRRINFKPILESIPADTDDSVESSYARAARSLLELGPVLVRDEASEEAMLRAFERATGAHKAGDDRNVRARLSEVSRFSEHATGDLRHVSPLMRDAADHLSRLQTGQTERSVARIGTLDVLLSDEVLANLYRAGVTIDRLKVARVHERSVNPETFLATALNDAAGSLETYSLALSEWNPEQDLGAVEVQARATVLFQVFRTEGRFRWRLIDSDNRVIAVSDQNYPTPADARHAIEILVEAIAEGQIMQIDEEE